MQTRYEFVDSEGDLIAPEMFVLERNLSVRLKHIRFEQDTEAQGYEQILVLVYEYLRGEPAQREAEMWNIAARVPEGQINTILEMLARSGIEVYRSWKVEYRP